MPIINLKTGELTDEQPFKLDPSLRDQKKEVERVGGGIIDLNTGGFVDQTNNFDINKERDELLIKQAEETSPVDAMLISAGKTVSDLGRMLPLGVEEETEVDKKALSLLREDSPISTAVGQALPFIVPGVGVANIASLPTRVLAATGLGGLEGATIASGTDKDVLETRCFFNPGV